MRRFKRKLSRDKDFWIIEVPELDIMTQGYTIHEVWGMLVDAIETLVDKPGFKVSIHHDAEEEFEIESNDDEALMALYNERKLTN